MVRSEQPRTSATCAGRTRGRFLPAADSMAWFGVVAPTCGSSAKVRDQLPLGADKVLRDASATSPTTAASPNSRAADLYRRVRARGHNPPRRAHPHPTEPASTSFGPAGPPTPPTPTATVPSNASSNKINHWSGRESPAMGTSTRRWRDPLGSAADRDRAAEDPYRLGAVRATG